MFLPAEPCPARTQIQCRGSLKACLAFSCQIHRELNIQWLENSAAKISYVPYFFHRQRLGGAHARILPCAASRARALRSRVWAGSRMPLPPERCAPASAPSPARRRLLSSPSSPALPLTHIRLDWGREEMPTWVTRRQICTPMLLQASEVYTPIIFEAFQGQYERSMAWKYTR